MSRLPCEGRSVPEGDACIPLLDEGAPLAPARAGARPARSTEAPPVESIPRRPDRNPDPAAYRFPLAGPPTFLRDFDQESPRTELPQGMRGVELSAVRGSEVRLVGLDAQVGPADVVGMGELVGKTIVTRHRVTEAGREKTYLVFHGRLDAFAPDAAMGASLDDGALLGFAGDSGAPGEVMLYLEARLLREDIDIGPLELERLADASVSVSIDARNVFPLVSPK